MHDNEKPIFSKFLQRKLLMKIEVSWDVTLCCCVPSVLKDHGAFTLTASGTSHPTRTRISSNTVVGTSMNTTQFKIPILNNSDCNIVHYTIL